MNIFSSATESHEHSLQTLNLLNSYDDFMDGIGVVCDMGCGSGLDLKWWADNCYQDENGNMIPRKIRTVGIDTDIRIAKSMKRNDIRFLEGNFEEKQLAQPADLIWSHDSFRYAVNPLQTLRYWNEQVNENGMLVLIVPQTINLIYNKLSTRTFPCNFFNHSISSLIYMLAVNGFDCNDGHFTKQANDPWLHCVVYKSNISPMDPRTTSWYQLAEKNLLPESATKCISKWGFLKQEELVTTWLDKNYVMWNRV